MSSTPIYDELAAILLADHPTAGQDAGKAAAAPESGGAEDAAPARTGGRRRKPEPDA